jgi:hypothetical protein
MKNALLLYAFSNDPGTYASNMYDSQSAFCGCNATHRHYSLLL